MSESIKSQADKIIEQNQKLYSKKAQLKQLLSYSEITKLLSEALIDESLELSDEERNLLDILKDTKFDLDESIEKILEVSKLDE
jgi:hypothetical protein|tara:strand:- start:928 stop:1179 length:252 start_codon:yes stop_codon:yes gene_type:complete